MELFRCVAMLLVVGVHANFFSLGAPTTIEVHDNSLPSFTRFLFQALCIGCVDMFVLLSGWFGIRPKLKGFFKLLFQVFFCVTLVYISLVLVGAEQFSVRSLAKAMCLGGAGWFVRAYIGLYILSPVLNAFAEKSSRQQFEYLLIAYFCFQCALGWIVNSADFADGYSTASFIFLYLLAQYVHIYHSDNIKRLPRFLYLTIFFAIAIIIAISAFILEYNGLGGFGRLYSYTSPTVIIMSLSLLIYFSRLSFRSRFVNWVATSSFSVYLLHNCLDFTIAKYKLAVQALYSSFSGVSCMLAIFAFVVAVYVVATLFDKIRIVCWDISKKV